VVRREAAADADPGNAGEGKLTMLRSIIVAVAALLAATSANAQDASALKQGMIGQWELSTTERSRTCVVTLSPDVSPQGFKLQLEPGCATTLPFTKAIVGWSVRGLDIVRLQNAQGEAVIDLTEVESGIFEGLREGEGVYILQNLAAARALAKSMDQMIGDWSMVRGSGKPVCGLTLTNTEATVPENYEVYLKPACDPAVKAFAPSMWRLEHGQMLLLAQSGESWHFEADDNAQWRKIPDSADPLIMLRQ
jgi:hypothetical protein